MRTTMAVLLALASVGCGGGVRYEVRGTDRAPALKADVEVEVEGARRDLDLEVHDLPAPGSIVPGASRYGVWMIAADGAATFLGFLRYQSELSYGDLETSIPLGAVDVIVTVEGAAQGASPSDAIVMRRALP